MKRENEWFIVKARVQSRTYEEFARLGIIGPVAQDKVGEAFSLWYRAMWQVKGRVSPTLERK